jgi:uncharacterized membrane protein YqjE
MMELGLLLAGLAIVMAVIYTVLSGLVLTQTEPTQNIAITNLVIACMSLVLTLFLFGCVWKLIANEKKEKKLLGQVLDIRAAELKKKDEHVHEGARKSRSQRSVTQSEDEDARS